MTKTADLLSSDLGKAFLQAQEKSERLSMGKRVNEIGESVIVEWNPRTLLEKHPFAEVVSQAYDEMLKRTIPNDMILSAQFQSWINREKNELMVDSRISRDDYFKQHTDFETGEITRNTKNDMLKAKMNLLEKELGRLEKAFTTFMSNKSNEAFANEEALQKWQEYYIAQKEKVVSRLESGDFSAYDKKTKDGNVYHEGNVEDAQKHNENIDVLLAKAGEMRAQQSAEKTAQNSSQTNSFQEFLTTEDASNLRKATRR